MKIKNKEEEVNVSRKRHPNYKHLLPALQAAPEHPHETTSQQRIVLRQ